MSDSVREKLDDIVRAPIRKGWRSHPCTTSSWDVTKGGRKVYSYKADTYTVRGEETIPAGDHFFDYNISVLEGAVLTIDPGARLFFASLCGIQVVDGKLVSRGEKNNKVKIYRMRGSLNGSAIKFFGEKETSLLRHTEIHGEEISFGPENNLDHILEYSPELIKLNVAHVDLEETTLFMGEYCNEAINLTTRSVLKMKGGGIVGGKTPLGATVRGISGIGSRLLIDGASFKDINGDVFANLIDCSTTVRSSTFENLRGNLWGGVFHVGKGTLTVTDSTFVKDGSNSMGGVYYLAGGTIRSRGNTYEECFSKQGGVIYVLNGSAYFGEDDFLSSRGENGGVVYVSYTSKELDGGRVELISCNGNNNHAKMGAIGYLEGGGLIVKQGKYRWNLASEAGNLAYWRDPAFVAFEDVNYLTISPNNFAHRRGFIGPIEKRRKI